MNVMAQAHKDCKARIAAGNPNRYADLFRVALRQAHKEFKAMSQAKPEQTIKVSDIAKTLANDYFDATGYSITGTVVSEACTGYAGNVVHVGEYSGSEMRMENDAAYYMNSKNGYSKQELILTLHGVESVIETFKIVK